VDTLTLMETATTGNAPNPNQGHGHAQADGSDGTVAFQWHTAVAHRCIACDVGRLPPPVHRIQHRPPPFPPYLAILS
jgi:hypothetical protein